VRQLVISGAPLCKDTHRRTCTCWCRPPSAHTLPLAHTRTAKQSHEQRTQSQRERGTENMRVGKGGGGGGGERERQRETERERERERARERERETKAPRLERAWDGDDDRNWPAASATFFGDDVVSRGVLCLFEIGTSRGWPSFPASPTPAVLSSEARRPIVTRRPGAEGLGFQVQDLGFRFEGFGFRVWDLGLWQRVILARREEKRERER
jgi:hypothetical protein